jgi:hypothetical protein
MTATELSPADLSIEPPGRPRWWRRWWALAAAIVVAAVVVTTVLIVRHDDRANALYSYYGVDEGWTFSVGTTAFVGSDIQTRGYKSGHHVLLLRTVTPRVTVNTAHARVRVMECTLADPHEGVGMTGVGYAKHVCASLRVFRPGRVDLGFFPTELAYIITPTTPGLVRVEGADVNYADGSREGTQHTGSGFVLRVKPAAR